METVWLMSFALAMTAGQLLFKQAAGSMAGQSGRAAALALALSPSLWLALAVYGAATVLWIWLLTRVPLSRAYPYAAVAMILVPLGSVLLYGERVRAPFWAGAALIAAGIVVAQRSVG